MKSVLPINFVYIIVDCRCNVVQQISRVYSSYLTETLYLMINNSTFPPSLQSLVTTSLVLDFMNLTILGTS